ncbi:hypothetical protein HPC49_01595 [Pyxidicoccus fallax]|uniref:Lipoprotein n=1 Tax=Pyxidicoccus fallax TaxID=394095 RepID=A0A848LAF2_9BACT|nr:hypothetical protein [Pyxidicoccus fallax]NMO16040.1 hypothetical protein [Pyxidicoccus fallax]NPC76947.1 hypothetical protein [Pyxidicoccus fallax]
MMKTWIRSMGLAGMLALGLAGCGGVEAPVEAEHLGQVEQAYIIACSWEDPSPCVRSSPFVCDYEQGICVPVCDDGTVCPSHRYCCN